MKGGLAVKYLILVSHGEFSQGLKQSLSMFAADNMDSVIAVGLLPGEAADTLGKRFEHVARHAIPASIRHIISA